MAGQVRVVIAEKEWLADLANNYWEQVQGLGGLPGYLREPQCSLTWVMNKPLM